MQDGAGAVVVVVVVFGAVFGGVVVVVVVVCGGAVVDVVRAGVVGAGVVGAGVVVASVDERVGDPVGAEREVVVREVESEAAALAVGSWDDPQAPATRVIPTSPASRGPRTRRVHRVAPMATASVFPYPVHASHRERVDA